MIFVFKQVSKSPVAMLLQKIKRKRKKNSLNKRDTFYEANKVYHHQILNRKYIVKITTINIY